MTVPERIDDASLESLTIGAVPILDAILDRLQLESILSRALPAPARGRKRELEPARCLMALLKNVLLARQPLYAMPHWLAGFVPERLGVTRAELALFNDDRIGRALDGLFEVDQTALITEVSLAAVRVFALRLTQLHNDSTSVTLHGRYADQEPSRSGKRPPTIAHGFNKDHRPDLKQLVFELTATADSMVPIFFKVHDGNTADDATHRDNWMTLKTLVGSANFLYVADCKLASTESMTFIDGQKGRFLSVLPRTRAETDWFRDYLDEHVVEWAVVRTDKSRRRKDEADNTYEGFESPQRSREGFRILWYRSSQKLKDDQDRRSHRIALARMRIEALETKLFRRRQRDEDYALAQARKILDDLEVADFLKVHVENQQIEEFAQEGRGRPGPNTSFRRVLIPWMRLILDVDDAALRNAARFAANDGRQLARIDRTFRRPVRPTERSADVGGGGANLTDAIENRSDSRRKLFGLSFSPYVHEVNLGLVEEEVVVQRRYFDSIVECGVHSRIDLVLKQHEIAHQHRFRFPPRGKRRPRRKTHEGRHRKTVHSHGNIGSRPTAFDNAIGCRDRRDACRPTNFLHIELCRRTNLLGFRQPSQHHRQDREQAKRAATHRHIFHRSSSAFDSDWLILYAAMVTASPRE